MARDFDGVNDNVRFGSDASIDAFATLSVSCWMKQETLGVGRAILTKNTTGGSGFIFQLQTTNNIRLGKGWSSQDGVWNTTGAEGNVTTPIHIGITYNNGATSNAPIIYVDGVSVAVTETTAPIGTANSDASYELSMGENSAGGIDYDGQQGWLCYDNTIWTGEMMNRARWWGRPGGAQKMYHPLVTTKLVNEGSATANGTATGTTMLGIPRVERNYCSMLGCGR